MHDVVQSPLHDAQEHFAGVFRRARRQREVAAELRLEHAVEAFELLLLAQARAVFADLAAAIVHAWRRIAALDGALRRLAPAPLQVQLDAFTPAQLANGIEMASHCQQSGVRGQESAVTEI